MVPNHVRYQTAPHLDVNHIQFCDWIILSQRFEWVKETFHNKNILRPLVNQTENREKFLSVEHYFDKDGNVLSWTLSFSTTKKKIGYKKRPDERAQVFI